MKDIEDNGELVPLIGWGLTADGIVVPLLQDGSMSYARTYLVKGEMLYHERDLPEGEKSGS